MTVTNPVTGETLAMTTTVLMSNEPTTTTNVARGHTYPAGMVSAGNELSALDQLAEEALIRAKVTSAQAAADRAARAAASRGSGGGSSEGGASSTSPTTAPSAPQPVDTTAPAPGASWTDGNRTNIQAGPTTVGRGVQAPIVIDLDGDGVEISPLGGSAAMFDFDDDGFRERTAWAGADDGLLVYDIGDDGDVTQAREIAFAAALGSFRRARPVSLACRSC